MIFPWLNVLALYLATGLIFATMLGAPDDYGRAGWALLPALLAWSFYSGAGGDQGSPLSLLVGEIISAGIAFRNALVGKRRFPFPLAALALIAAITAAVSSVEFGIDFWQHRIMSGACWALATLCPLLSLRPLGKSALRPNGN